MTRTRWIIACSWLLLFWLFAGAVWAPAIQRRLEEKAAALVQDIQTGHEPISIHFSGQQAILIGKVRHNDQKQALENTIAEKLRLPGFLSANLNPVIQLRSEIELAPYPPGWLLLAAQGTRSMVYGTLASDYEARDVSQLLQDRWSKVGGRLVSRLKSDGSRFDEAPSIETTLDQMPPPRMDRGGDSAQVQIAHLGGQWERLTLDATDDHLRGQLASYPITDEEWQHIILPALEQTRRYQQAERIRLAEAERQAKLPPPHIFIASRDQRLLLRGEVATLKIKREFLNTVIVAFPEWRVIDDIRVNAQRRAVADFGPITTALLPLGTEPGMNKALALGLSNSAWQFVDWEIGEEAQPWKDLLPQDLPSSMLLEDSKMVTQWLQGNAQGIPTLSIPAQPSFLTLTLLPDKVILAGQLAEEALRTRLIEATRRAYAGQAIIFSDALLARGTCEPTLDVEQTTRSLPPLPKENEAPILAFARPGQIWKSQPASEAILAPGALAKSSLTPPDFPAAMAEDTFAAEAYDQLRHYWRQLATPAKENPTR